MRPERASDIEALRPLDPVDLDGLIPTFVATWADVDFAERVNIALASRWAFGRRRVATPSKLLSPEFSDRVHRKMFDGVWRWAGERRSVEHAHGVRPDSIADSLLAHLTTARRRHATAHGSPEERARELHDALVDVCAYPDGNRRHARFMADLYLHVSGEPRLDWTRDVSLAGSIADSVGAQATAERSALQAALDQVARPRQLEESLDRVAKRRR